MTSHKRKAFKNSLIIKTQIDYQVVWSKSNHSVRSGHTPCEPFFLCSVEQHILLIVVKVRVRLSWHRFLLKKLNYWYGFFFSIENYCEQECIPVGCVPPALYRTEGSLSGGASVRGVSVRGVSVALALWTDRCLWKYYLAPNFVCGR